MMIEPIVRTVVARCTPERAFAVFTTEMDSWWPIGTHSRAAVEHEGEDIRTERIEFEERVGGRVLEHLSNGDVLPWAEVLAWDPPHGLTLAWRPHGRPQPPTEVEVTFEPHPDGTLVTLEHRGWEHLAEDHRDLYESYGGGWVATLSRYADAAA